MKSRRLTTSMITALVIAFVHFSAPNVKANEKIDGLSDEQMSFVNRMTAFMSDRDRRYFDRIAKLNGGLQLETATASSVSSDLYTTNVTSYEAWSLATLPPEVKF